MLLGAKGSFHEEIALVSGVCSECHERIGKGAIRLVARRNGRVQKVVCGEKCRDDFEARIWDEIAERHEQSPRWRAIRSRK